VGRVVAPDSRTPNAIRDAALTVLGDPSYSSNARDFQAQMAALPGPDQLVELLEALDHHTVGTASR
jgi:UDP:flavonoid glycosyltransferase YjiC (YdhE family)